MKRLLKKILLNKYFIASAIFLIYLTFFDSNNLLMRFRYVKKKAELNEEKQILQKKITDDSIIVKNMNDPEYIEKIAREKYYMKKDSEVVFLIEYKDDSLTKK